MAVVLLAYSLLQTVYLMVNHQIQNKSYCSIGTETVLFAQNTTQYWTYFAAWIAGWIRTGQRSLKGVANHLPINHSTLTFLVSSQRNQQHPQESYNGASSAAYFFNTLKSSPFVCFVFEGKRPGIVTRQLPPQVNCGVPVSLVDGKYVLFA